MDNAETQMPVDQGAEGGRVAPAGTCSKGGVAFARRKSTVPTTGDFCIVPARQHCLLVPG